MHQWNADRASETGQSTFRARRHHFHLTNFTRRTNHRLKHNTVPLTQKRNRSNDKEKEKEKERNRDRDERMFVRSYVGDNILSVCLFLLPSVHAFLMTLFCPCLSISLCFKFNLSRPCTERMLLYRSCQQLYWQKQASFKRCGPAVLMELSRQLRGRSLDYSVRFVTPLTIEKQKDFHFKRSLTS